MKSYDENIKNLYLSDQYISLHPSLHEEDVLFKVSKITPLIDKIFDNINNKKEINLLDVGGGNGLILKTISEYLMKKYQVNVNKFALDLSPGMLQIQKKTNPDIRVVLNEDICQTSLNNKDIDLTLMIDVLEHISDPIRALKELQRISRFVIFKVPLEQNLSLLIGNLINRGKTRRRLIESIGHVNAYTFNKLRYQMEKYLGTFIDYFFTNVFDYYLNSGYYKKNMSIKHKSINFIASKLFKVSPKLCSYMFTDFVVVLVRCYDNKLTRANM